MITSKKLGCNQRKRLHPEYKKYEKEGKKDMTIKEAYHWIWENTCLMQDTMMFDFECLEYCVKHGILKEIDKEHFEVA